MPVIKPAPIQVFRKEPWRTGYTVADGVTQGMLGEWMGCRQSMAYILDGWETKGSVVGTALGYGDMVHRALAAHYRLGAKHPEVMTKVVNQIVRAQVKSLSNKDDVEKLEYQGMRAEVCLSEYARYWGKDDKKRNWVQVEPVFDVNWHNFRLRGRIDAVFQQGDPYWVLETKTSSRISEDTLGMWLAFALQPLFYVTALPAHLASLPGFQGPSQVKKIVAAGSLYNIVRTPQVEGGKDRLIKHIRGSYQHYFKRFTLTYPKVSIASFEEQLHHKVHDFRQWAQGLQPTYKCEVSCMGMYNCGFIKACASDSMVGYARTRKLFRELEDEE